MSESRQNVDTPDRFQKLRNGRPTVEALAAHPYIARVEDVSFNSERELFEVSFHGPVPEVFSSIDGITIVACWIGLLPGWWGKLIGEERARKYGFGGDCITVLVEVEP